MVSGRPYPPLDELEDLIELVYEGPLEPRPWQSFLPALRMRLDAEVVSLVLRPPAADDRGVILNCRRNETPGAEEGLADPGDWEAITYREQFFAIDPFVNLPPGEVVTQQELVPDEELLASEYYLDYLQPIGLFHILGADTVATDGMQARLRIARRREEAPFDETHKAICAKLLPHLRRAIQIHTRLSHTASERDLYADAVDHLAMAALVLDEHRRVLNTNSQAGILLKSGDGLRIAERRLRISDRETDAQLQTLIRDAIAAQRSRKTGVVHALRIPRRSGRQDYGLVLRPVAVSEWAEGQAGPCVAVFISDPATAESSVEDIPGEMLQALFGLTPAEASLALKLSRGLTLADVSSDQNISQHTARAQLKSIFAKTGVTRQADLVRVVLKSAATLA